MSGNLARLTCLVILLMYNCKMKPSLKVFQSDDPRITWYGRTHIDNSENHYLIGSASSIKFRFAGDKCRIWMKNISSPGEYNYISWVLDGVYHQRIPIRSDTLIPIEIPIKGNDEFHELEIFKETEAVCGGILIDKIETAELIEYPISIRRNIEFIGNSITAGMASDPSLIPCETGKWYDQHNAYMAYGPRTARALEMDFMIVAVSGIGVYRNWNTEYPVMNDVYESIFLSTDPNLPKWGFKSFIPDVVCINLGTNDFSGGDGITARLPFDSTLFIQNYIQLIEKIHSHYPEARIVMLEHAMSGDHIIPMLQGCLNTIKIKSEAALVTLKPLSVFSFSPSANDGCSGHPDLREQTKMAEELTPFIRGLLQ